MMVNKFITITAERKWFELTWGFNRLISSS
jgi:hypothetical protein